MNEMVITVGIVLPVLCIMAVWFIRFFGEMGAGGMDNRFGRWCREGYSYQGEPLHYKTAVKVFAAAFLVRVAIWLLGVVVCTQFVPYYQELGTFGFSEFLQSLCRWDAMHYLNLAELGYQDYIEDGQHLFLVFFPLYPWLVRIVHAIVPNWMVAALAVSSLSFCIGSVFFYGVLQEEYGKKIAKRSFSLFCVAPFAFFFGGIMTESLFFCLLSAGFFYIRRHNWLAAGIIGTFCSMCRVQGILLLGVGLVEFFVTYRPFDYWREGKLKQFGRLFLTKCSFLFLTLVGNFIYFGINKSVEGDWFRFRVYQEEHWYHTTTWVTKCVNEIVSYFFHTNDMEMRKYVWLPEIALFIAAMLLLACSLRHHPLRYSAFLFVYTLVNYSVTFLISGGRYMACALPMFWFLAELTVRHKFLYYLYYLILIVSLGFLVFFLHGFMSGQQVL